MPRKSTKKVETTTEETKEKKTTKKRATAKKAEVTTKETEALIEEIRPTFSIEEMINWTDEECKAKDNELKFYTSDIRDILKTVKALKEELGTVSQKFDILRFTLSKGVMTGYKIICPHCKREYMVSSTELNRTAPIMCKICGTEYKEDENIDGITLATEGDNVEVI